eukprot:358982_1
MGDLEDESADVEFAAWISAIVYNVTAVVNITLCGIHALKVYQDLYTAERKSTSHRKRKPELKQEYRRINWLVLASMLMFTASTISGVFSPFSTTDKECDNSITSVILFMQIGKSMMYIAFLMRIYRIYQHSPFGYPFKCVKFFIVVLII